MCSVHTYTALRQYRLLVTEQHNVCSFFLKRKIATKATRVTYWLAANAKRILN